MNSTFLKTQKAILNKRLLAKIHLKISSLLDVGGYNARPYSVNLDLQEGLREQSLKGIWRWWARAAVSGALGGKLHMNKIDEKISNIFGSTNFASKISISMQPFINQSYQQSIEQLLKTIDEFIKDVKTFFKTEARNILRKYDRKIQSCNIKISPVEPKIAFESKHRFDTSDIKTIVQIVKSSKSLEKWIDEKELTNLEKNRRGHSKKKVNIPLDIRVSISGHSISLKRYCQIPRVKISLMPTKTESDTIKIDNVDSIKVERYVNRIKEELVALIQDESECLLELYNNIRMSSDEVCFAISTLLLSLMLGGVGSSTGRGFGALNITKIEMPDNIRLKMPKDLIEIIDKVNKLNEKSCVDLQDLEEFFEELVEKAVKFAGKILGKVEHITEMPEIPSLDPNFTYFRLKVVPCFKTRLEVLHAIGNATLKQEWKKIAGMSIKASGRFLHTWILGLPRKQKGRGYLSKINRRQSAIRMTVKKYSSKYFIVLYGFLSKDWPDDLKHIGEIKSNIKVGDTNIRAAFDYAFSTMLKILGKYCGRS